MLSGKLIDNLRSARRVFAALQEFETSRDLPPLHGVKETPAQASWTTKVRPEDLAELREIVRDRGPVTLKFIDQGTVLAINEVPDLAVDADLIAVFEKPLADSAFLYIASRNLTEDLALPLDELKNTAGQNSGLGPLFAAMQLGPIDIFVADEDVALWGGHLRILGGRFLDQEPEDRPASKPPAAAATFAAKNLKWAGFSLGPWTPWHFANRGSSPNFPPGNLQTAALRRWLEMAWIFLANETRFLADRKWLVVFATGEQRVELDLAQLGNFWHEHLEQVGEWLEWIYCEPSGLGADRLRHLQGVIARTLDQSSASPTFSDLWSHLGQIERNREASWETFAKRRVDTFFEKEREFEKNAAQAAQDFTDAAGRLTRTLTDDTKAAIAVVVGSFIAAIFQKTFQPTVFAAGLTLYGFYIILLPGSLQAHRALREFHLRWSRFCKDREAFIRILGSSKVAEIQCRAKAKEAYRDFKWVHTLTTTVNWLIGLLFLAVAIAALAVGSD